LRLLRREELVGTGKTFLASAVIDHVRDKIGAALAPEGFAFFYCGELDPAGRRTSAPLLLSLMRQLLPLNNRRVIKILKKLAILWDDGESNSPELTKGLITDWLLETVRFYPATTIVLDGLDSLTPSALSELVATLGFLLETSRRPLRLFLSSKDNAGVPRLASSSVLWYQTGLQHWRRHDREGIDEALPQTFFDIEKVVVQEWSEIPLEVRYQVVRESEGL
jgi:hypothetical protein